MLFNLHTHSNFCDHATGDVEEYIKVAVQNGFSELGFSEHAPFTFPDGHQSHYRLPVERAEEYVETLRALREKYKNQIKIHIGFEMEYYPLYFKKMLELAKSVGAEYIIQGQHFIDSEYPNGKYVSYPFTDPEILKQYVIDAIAGMETGKFTYLAHPDLCHFSEDEALYKEEMRKICKASVRLNIPLELNLLGIREGRHYPNEAFWQIAGEEKAPVIIGFDSHSPNSLGNIEALNKAMETVKKYNLSVVSEPKIKKL